MVTFWTYAGESGTTLNDDVILLCIYSDGLLQPSDLQLGAPTAYAPYPICSRIPALAVSILAFRDLLFTVVIH